jgi:hypothetical protein
LIYAVVVAVAQPSVVLSVALGVAFLLAIFALRRRFL